MSRVELHVIDGPHKGKAFSFSQADRFLVGRSEAGVEAHFRLGAEEPCVSRHHCIFDISPPAVHVRDLNSRNGTFVLPAGQAEYSRVESAELREGDLVWFGYTVMKVKVSGGEERTLKLPCVLCGRSFSWTDTQPERDRGDKGGVCRQCREKGPPASHRRRGRPGVLNCADCGSSLPPLPPADAGSEEIASRICGPCAQKQRRVRAEDIGPYRILSELGRGNMGVVYKAWHEPTGELRALKRVMTEQDVHPKQSMRFRCEMAVMGRLAHPNIVRLLEQGTDEKGHYFASEYLPGGDLEDLVCAVHKGPVPYPEAVRLICETLKGLEYAHEEGFVHRDLKPQNILLGPGEPGVVSPKIADFGLAKSYFTAGQSGFTDPWEIMGTPLYMAPEQFTNFRFVKPPADLYSIGATLYYLLTASHPYDTAAKRKDLMLAILEDDPIPILERDPKLPRTLAEAVDKSLRRDARERFQTAAGMRLVLARALREAHG